MKRGIALLLALCMLMTLSACGKKNKKEKAEEDGGFIYSGRFCHSLYIIHGQERVGAFFH